MSDRLEDLDYCPECDLPTFDHEVVQVHRGQYYHAHCFNGSVRVVKREDLLARAPEPTGHGGRSP